MQGVHKSDEGHWGPKAVIILIFGLIGKGVILGPLVGVDKAAS